MNCRSCGSPIGEGDKFCAFCGAKQTADIPAAEPVLPEIQEETAPETVEELIGDVPEEVVPDEIPAAEEIVLPEPVKEPEDVISVIDSVLGSTSEVTETIVPEEPAQDVVEFSSADIPEFAQEEIPVQPQPFYGQEAAPEFQAAPSAPYIAPAEDKPVKVGALRVTGAAIVSFFAVIIMIVVTMLFSVRLGITGDSVSKRIKKMNPQTVFSAEIDEGLRFSDAIYNEAGIRKASGGLIGKDQFWSYMCKIDALGFAGDHAKEYIDYIFNGKGDDPSVTNSDLAELFIDNTDVADEVFSIELQTADYNAIRSTLKKKDTASNFAISTFSEKTGFRMENTKYIVSPVTIGIFTALLLVLLIWVIVILDKSGKHLISFYGGIFSSSGTICALAGVAVTIGAAVAHVITGNIAFYVCASVLLPFGIYAFCIGTAESLIGFILKRIRKASRIKQKRNDAVKKALEEAQA